MTYGCPSDVPWMFPECSLNVPWMFPECFLNVPWMFPECSLIYYYFNGGIVGSIPVIRQLFLLTLVLGTQELRYSSCILRQPWYFFKVLLAVGMGAHRRSLNTHWMFPECSLNVPYMFPEYFLNLRCDWSPSDWSDIEPKLRVCPPDNETSFGPKIRPNQCYRGICSPLTLINEQWGKVPLIFIFVIVFILFLTLYYRTFCSRRFAFCTTTSDYSEP
jgi:hypothetical protein